MSGDISFKEKLRSLSFQGFRSDTPPKVTTDIHDSHSVDVTEHWSERVDVTVKPDPIKVGLTVQEN